MNSNSKPSNTILVVDDDLEVRQMVSEMLQMHGYRVIMVDSGPNGLTCFAKHHKRVDLVLSDIVMPEMSGTEMVQQILTMDPHMPVIFMTGGVLDTKLLERPTDKHPVLLKPFTSDSLVRTVRHLLEQRPTSDRRIEIGENRPTALRTLG